MPGDGEATEEDNARCRQRVSTRARSARREGRRGPRCPCAIRCHDEARTPAASPPSRTGALAERARVEVATLADVEGLLARARRLRDGIRDMRGDGASWE